MKKQRMLYLNSKSTRGSVYRYNISSNTTRIINHYIIL